MADNFVDAGTNGSRKALIAIASWDVSVIACVLICQLVEVECRDAGSDFRRRKSSSWALNRPQPAALLALLRSYRLEVANSSQTAAGGANEELRGVMSHRPEYCGW